MIAARTSDFDAIQAYSISDVEAIAEMLTGAKLRSGRTSCPFCSRDPADDAFSVRNGEGWHCFRCGGHGDGVELLRRLRFASLHRKEGRVQALRALAYDAGVDLIGECCGPLLSARSRLNTPNDLRAAPQDDGTVRRVLSTAYDAMQLGPMGRDYLHGRRGFDADRADGFGFRSLESRRDWDAIRDALAAHTQEDRERAGLKRLPLCVVHHGERVTFRDAGPVLVMPFHSITRDVFGWRLCAMSAGALGTKGGRDRRYHSLSGVTLVWPFDAPMLSCIDGHVIHVVEGEFNAFALRSCGARAVGLPGAKMWRDEWTAMLWGASRVVAWYDNDAPGIGAREALARRLDEAFGRVWMDARWRSVILPGGDARVDANDLFCTGDLADFVKQERWNG